MEKKKSQIITNIVNVVAVALIIECFLCSFLLVRRYGRENCFERIDETTGQVGKMFLHAMDDNQDKLTVFADILGANSSNTDEYLQKLMENFCETQTFTAVCIHRADGTTVSMGNHPHDEKMFQSFEEEAGKLPYTSSVISTGEKTSEKYVYQVVPVIRSGETVGILYGYISLDMFPTFIDTMAYDGKCQFYIVDGESGDFLMDEYHGTLGNIYDGSMEWESKDGYDVSQMRDDVYNGKSGYYVFRSQRTGEWYYTCYQPLGINNWSIQLTIDETTAFAGYQEVNRTLIGVAICVVLLMVAHLLALMHQSNVTKNKDKANLHRSNYIAEIQRILLNAHANTDLIDQALKTIGSEMQCETVLLLSFVDKIVKNAHYWPSKDIGAVNELMGRNIRNDFPMLYDQLSGGTSIFFDGEDPSMEISESAGLLFGMLDIRNMAMVPVADHNGVLKGALCVVNLAGKKVDFSMLECVTYDFFMTLTNVENMETIRTMGTMDYMTRVKNRNCYETERDDYRSADCESLWCMFVDVNGLHEVNNIYGHKAGDVMLCAVADVVRGIFGVERTYRMGGDEFVAFAENRTEAELEQIREEIDMVLSAKGYHVAVGYMGVARNDEGFFEVERIVTGAEAIMYRNKREYYQKNKLPERNVIE